MGACIRCDRSGGSGIWELFVPGLDEGAAYKFEIRSKLGDLPFMKADPYAFEAELRPKSASLVRSVDSYAWQDSAWMDARAKRDWLADAHFGLRSALGFLAPHRGGASSLAYLP